MAALSFKVHSATTLDLISFIYNIKAFSGFLICGFFLSEIKINNYRHNFSIMTVYVKAGTSNFSNFTPGNTENVYWVTLKN